MANNLYSYNVTPVTVLTDGAIPFNIIGRKLGNAITHEAGSTAISLNEVGYYLVNFNATMVESGTIGNVQVKLLQDGVAVGGAVSTSYSAADDDLETVSFSAIVRVLPNCASVPFNLPSVLTVQNTGVGATLTDVAINVVRIG
jgi:hypothetical protein